MKALPLPSRVSLARGRASSPVELLSVKTVSNEIMLKENNLIHLQHTECNENHDSA